MSNKQIPTGKFREIKGDDFDKFVADASTKCLLDAHHEYLTEVESMIKLVGRVFDFTEPEDLRWAGSFIGVLCVYAARLNDINHELYDRHAPVGHSAD